MHASLCIASVCSVCVSSSLSASARQNLAVQTVCCPLSFGMHNRQDGNSMQNRQNGTGWQEWQQEQHWQQKFQHFSTVLVAPLLCIHAATQSETCMEFLHGIHTFCQFCWHMHHILCYSASALHLLSTWDCITTADSTHRH